MPAIARNKRAKYLGGQTRQKQADLADRTAALSAGKHLSAVRNKEKKQPKKNGTEERGRKKTDRNKTQLNRCQKQERNCTEGEGGTTNKTRKRKEKTKSISVAVFGETVPLQAVLACFFLGGSLDHL